MACHALPFKRCAPLILPGSSFWVPLLRRGSEAVLWGSRAASEHPTMHSQTGLCVAGTPACPISPKHRTLFHGSPGPGDRIQALLSSRQAGSSPPSRSPGCSHFQADPREAGGSERKHSEQNSLGTGSQTTNGGSPKHSDLRASAKHQNAGRRKPSRTHPALGHCPVTFKHTHQEHLRTRESFGLRGSRKLSETSLVGASRQPEKIKWLLLFILLLSNFSKFPIKHTGVFCPRI